MPAWEDPVNATGGDMSIKITVKMERAKDIWEGFVLDILTGSFPAADKLTGFRMCDKGYEWRLEFWVTYPSEAADSDSKLHYSHIKIRSQELCGSMILNELRFSDHKH